MRISERFEERFLGFLKEVAGLGAAEIDHECIVTQYPVKDPSGGAALQAGISVILACPTFALGEHVMVTGLIEDPYAPGPALKAQVGLLVQGLYRQRSAVNAAVSAEAVT